MSEGTGRRGVFNYIRPRTREERKLQGDREYLEKRRLEERREGFLRYDAQEAVLTPGECSASYLSEADRFNTDSCGEMTQARRREWERRQRSIDATR